MLLESQPEVAASVQNKYRHLLVDEYQDTDPAQERLLNAWLGGNTSLCVVGDPRQTIYSFKGAEPALLTTFTRRYPEAVTVSLVRDYRSGPQIVALANRIMANTAANGGAHEELIGLGPTGPTPAVTAYATEHAEAWAVAQRVGTLISADIAPTEIAVLVRFNHQAVALATALATAGIRTSSGGEDYFSRPEITAALNALGRIAADDPNIDTHSALLRAATATGYDAEEVVPGAGAVAERHEALASLVDLGASLVEQGHTTAATAHDDLLRRRQEQHTPGVSRAVTVSTIHKAKGLEWDVVFLPRMTDGSLPSMYAKTPAALDEERRLLYVAVTRARHSLYVSFAGVRDNGRATRQSPYTALLRPDTTGTGSRRKPRDTASVPNPGSPSTGATTIPWPKAGGGPEPTPEWMIGMRVTHDTHGMGAIIALEPNHVIVDFGEGPSKARRVKTADRRLNSL